MATIAPAFIDLQLYGANNRLLAEYPDAQTVSDIVQYSKHGGAAWCMPTVATNRYEVIFKCIDAVKSYWQQGGTGALGLHVEGPWISPERRGAHNPELDFCTHLSTGKRIGGAWQRGYQNHYAGAGSVHARHTGVYTDAKDRNLCRS